MREEDFRAELRYRMSLSAARAMHRDGLITAAEYRDIDGLLLERHRPPVGTLLAGRPFRDPRG